MHHTKDKGDIGSLVIAADIAKKGLKLLAPMSEHLPFDLVAYDEATSVFYRIQCKYRSLKDAKVILKLKTCYSTKNGVQTQRYAHGSFDVVAVYCPELEKIAYIRETDLTHLANSVTLRPNGVGRTFENLSEFPK